MSLAELDEEFQELAAIAAGQTQRPSIHVEFETVPMEDEEASKKAGKRVFRDVDIIIKKIPGERDEIRHEVTDEEKREFAAIYLAHKRREDQTVAAGFPLREWPLLRKNEAETLIAAGVKTVEQLARAPDTSIQHIGPYMQKRQQARDWLEQQEKGAVLARLRAENEELRGRVVAMERMLNTQSSEIAKARENGGALPAAAAPDPRITEMQAQIAALAAAVQVNAPPPVVEAVKPNGAPKRRGRPPGSKNKPKAAPET